MNWLDYIVILIFIIWGAFAFWSYKKQKNGCHGNCAICLLKSEDLKKQYHHDKEVKKDG